MHSYYAQYVYSQAQRGGWAPDQIEAWMREAGTNNTLCGFGPAQTVGTGHGQACFVCQSAAQKLIDDDIESYGELSQGQGPTVETEV